MNLKCIDYSLAAIIVGVSIVFIVGCEMRRPSEGSIKFGIHITKEVTALAETEPVPQNKNDDSADDPAIWINPENSLNSFVIGTDKKGGLITYDLNGKKLNYYAHGCMNNCDLRYGFDVGDKQVDVLAASNRTLNSIALYFVQKGGVLIPANHKPIISKMRGEVYGLCMYRSPRTGKYFVFVNSKAGEVEQWELLACNSKIDAKLVRAWDLGIQTEGMVADDERGVIYIGEEVAGIFKFDAEPEGAIAGTLIPMSIEENKNIRYDIEGLAIYRTDNINGYLLASSQGNYSYAVFERQGDNRYLGSFKIVDGKYDGADETDGIEVTNVPLGLNYPRGMLIVQDGYNFNGQELVSQNFKYVSWADVEEQFK